MPSNYQSPYNFVPLSEQIVFPEWGDRVSQDIPFSDGLDGELDLTITALSPIFIRKGAVLKKGDKASTPDDFFQDATTGRFCIPGTSLKGMIRNVMEIASFGKLQHISDKRYAIRDLNNTAYRTKFTNGDLSTKVQAGWLDISDKNNWKIFPCKFAMWDRATGCGQLGISTDFGNRRQSAAEKYLKFAELSEGRLEQRANVRKVSGKDANGNPIIPHLEAEFRPDGEYLGKVVFTGQPQDYWPGTTGQKHHEFFFYDREENFFWVDEPKKADKEDDDEENRHPNRTDFLFAHTEQSGCSQDWNNWDKSLLPIRNQHFDKRIPVFYLKSDDGKLRFGLAMMFRFGGEVSVGEAARNSNPEHFTKRGEDFRPDLADLVFGFVNPKRSLRGRVQFSSAEASGAVEPLPPEKVILGAPKPTFHPAYLQQPNAKNGEVEKDKYKTFLDKDAKLRGWKRYPVLNDAKFIPPEKASDKTYTSFRALPSGTQFRGKLRYHNLRPIELGALLWCIQMNQPNYYCHSLGMAKPYGYGKVKLAIEGLTEEEIRNYKKVFIDYMDGMLGQKFRDAPQIKALLAMAKFDNAKPDWDFQYLSLAEYRDYKGKKGSTPGLVLAEYPEPKTVEPPKPPPAPDASAVLVSEAEKELCNWLTRIGAPTNKNWTKELPKLLRKLPEGTKVGPQTEQLLRAKFKKELKFGDFTAELVKSFLP